jgi:hypothetical protein
MSVSLPEHRLAGYVVTRTFARPPYVSADLLPDAMVSMSDCLADFVPDVWTLEWTKTSESDRVQKAGAFGLSPVELLPLMAWCTAEFGRVWGWPCVLYELGAARDLHRHFLSSATNLRLLGLALPEDLAPDFLEAAKPLPHEGATGLYTCVAANHQLESGGIPLGWEVLGFEYGFHSWLCNGLERNVFREFGIRPAENGLIQSAADARQAADYCGLESVGAEPGIWLPWLIVEYPFS